MAKRYLDDAVNKAQTEDSSGTVRELMSVESKINLSQHSPFWQLMYNQIYITKQAQMSTSD